MSDNQDSAKIDALVEDLDTLLEQWRTESREAGEPLYPLSVNPGELAERVRIATLESCAYHLEAALMNFEANDPDD